MCHHSATVRGLTSHTHSFNKYLLSAYLQGTLGEGAAVQALLVPLPRQCSLLERRLGVPAPTRTQAPSW